MRRESSQCPHLSVCAGGFLSGLAKDDFNDWTMAISINGSSLRLLQHNEKVQWAQVGAENLSLGATCVKCILYLGALSVPTPKLAKK